MFCTGSGARAKDLQGPVDHHAVTPVVAAQDAAADVLEAQDGGDLEDGAPLAEGAPWTPRSGDGNGDRAQPAQESVRFWEMVLPSIKIRHPARITSFGSVLLNIPLPNLSTISTWCRHQLFHRWGASSACDACTERATCALPRDKMLGRI